MIRRRTALGLLAAGTLGAAVAPAATTARASGPAGRFDPSDPRHLATAFRKLAYSLDDSVTFWWMHGTRYGVVGSRSTPFWDMHVGAWFRTRDLGEDRYEVRVAFLNFYTPPGEEGLLEKFRNPYTGRTLEVPYAPPRATTTTMGLRGGSPFDAMKMPGMKTTVSSDVGPAHVNGDELTIRGDLILHAEPEEAGRRGLDVNDWSTYVGSLAAVQDPAQKNPPAQQMFNDILDFPAWLQMGDVAGTFFSRCYGRKVYGYDEMPQTWRRLFEGRFPDAAKNAAAVLDR
jgi:hypothetical protein